LFLKLRMITFQIRVVILSWANCWVLVMAQFCYISYRKKCLYLCIYSDSFLPPPSPPPQLNCILTLDFFFMLYKILDWSGFSIWGMTANSWQHSLFMALTLSFNYCLLLPATCMGSQLSGLC
jgi:hypothetical protein